MNTVYIDFSNIGDYEDFYAELKTKTKLPEYFGENLDALYDVLSTEMELPMHLEFVNLSIEQLEIFEDLLNTLEDTDEDVEDFSFTYFLEQYDD